MSEDEHIFDLMVAAGVPTSVDNCTDLMVPVTPASTEIVEAYKHKDNVRKEKSEKGKDHNYRIPMAYAPFWRNIKKYDFGS
jgi:hypothetical protein